MPGPDTAQPTIVELNKATEVIVVDADVIPAQLCDA
jgi:hypothetical protein